MAKIAHDVVKLAKQLSRIGRPEELHLVYEAGPTGYGLQRSLSSYGYACEVIAPAQMPRLLATESRQTGATASSWQSVHAPGNCVGCGFPIQPTRRYGTCRERAKTR